MNAPIALAIWIAAVPTPDAPACTSAHRPLLRPPCSTSASQAVMNTSGMAAPSSVATDSGMAISWRSWMAICSASQPPASMAITRSPGFHSLTRSPTAATTPDISMPGISGLMPRGSG